MTDALKFLDRAAPLTYRYDDGWFQVGRFGTDGEWYAEGDFKTRDEALAHITYLHRVRPDLFTAATAAVTGPAARPKAVTIQAAEYEAVVDAVAAAAGQAGRQAARIDARILVADRAEFDRLEALGVTVTRLYAVLSPRGDREILVSVPA